MGRIVNIGGETVATFSDVHSVVFDMPHDKQVWVLVKSGTQDTEPIIALSPKDGGKLCVSDACGNSMRSTLNNGMLYVSNLEEKK